MRRLAKMAAVALLATTLVACGEEDVCSQPDGGGCYPVPDPSDEPNDADEDFVLDHALSVGEVDNLAELAADTSDDPAVVELADAYGETTDDLLDTFEDLREAWDLEPPVYDGTPGAGQSAPLPQYAGDDDYDVLEGLSGDEFDTYWIEVMLERADEQIRATEDLLDEGSDAALRSAAEEWIGANEVMLASLQDLQRDQPS